jgi:hypothetical protein
MISRRRLLIGAATAAAGATAGVVLTVNNPFTDLPEAAAAADEKFKYRGRDVVLSPHGNMVHARVNGKGGLHGERFQGEYLTHLLPFGTFKSPRKMAEAVIDAEADGLLII